MGNLAGFRFVSVLNATLKGLRDSLVLGQRARTQLKFASRLAWAINPPKPGRLAPSIDNKKPN
jgi:hypothetical protein